MTVNSKAQTPAKQVTQLSNLFLALDFSLKKRNDINIYLVMSHSIHGCEIRAKYLK